MPTPKRYLLWDFDKTLAFRGGGWSQCLADVASKATGGFHRKEHFTPHLQSGFPWHAPERAHVEVTDAEGWWSNLYPTLEGAFRQAVGFDAPAAQELSRQVRKEYTRVDCWEVYPDTAPALAALSRAGWRHLILSNHVPELPELVDALGLSRHFDAVYTSALIGYEKPHANAFAAVLATLPPGTRVVMLGDKYRADIAGATAAGLEAILVRATHPARGTSFLTLADLVNSGKLSAVSSAGSE